MQKQPKRLDMAIFLNDVCSVQSDRKYLNGQVILNDNSLTAEVTANILNKVKLNSFLDLGSGHLSKELVDQNSVVCMRQGKKISCSLVLFCFIWLLLLSLKNVEVTLALLSHSSSLKIDLSFHCLHTIKTQLISIEL